MAKKNDKTTCKIKGCDELFYAKGFCKFHYIQWYRGLLDADGKPTRPLYNSLHARCKIKDCGRLITSGGSKSLGFCSRDYYRYRAGMIDKNGKILRKIYERKS